MYLISIDAEPNQMLRTIREKLELTVGLACKEVITSSHAHIGKLMKGDLLRLDGRSLHLGPEE